jgi:hypothetical protein
MLSATCNKIKNRETPNNVFITPVALAKTHIDMIETMPTDVWLDPFKNSGNYYNQFPTENKEYTEILEGKDFFDYTTKVDVICSNPPYSMIDKVLEHSVKLEPRVISYLIGINNITPKRIEYMEKNGYNITKLHMCKVRTWFGMTLIVVFEKNKPSIMTYDRVSWKNE